MDALWEEYRRTPTVELRNRLVERYHHLVALSAKALAKGLPRHVRWTDLTGAGAAGLVHAVERYRPERGVKFETYAALRVEGAMRDELRALDWVPRLERQRERLGLAEPRRQLSLERLSRAVTYDHPDRRRCPVLAAFERADAAEFLVRFLGQRLGGIVVRYHLDGVPMWQIGEEMGMSESNVSFLHKEALSWLRQGLSQPRYQTAL